MADTQKILIVDDRPENLLALEIVLRETSADVIRTTNGNEALKFSLHHDFALAILDVQMPVMDGYELAELLRGDKKTHHLPIIFLTAVYSDEHHVFKGYSAGAVDFVTKPYRPEILLAKVNIFLQLDRQKRELKKAVELEKAKHHLENIISSMSDAVMVVSKDGRIQIANGALISLLGYDPGKIVGLPLTTLFAKQTLTPRILSMMKDLGSGDIKIPAFQNEDGHLTGKNGEALPILISGSVLLDRENVSYGAVFVARDIRERVKARKELKASEKKYRTLYETSRDGIALFDMAGNFRDANQAFLEMVGYEAVELRRLSNHELTPAKWHDMEKTIFQNQVLIRRYSDEFEKEYIRKDGSIFPVAIRLWLTQNDKGDPDGVWVFARDMTLRRIEEQNRILSEKMNAVGMMAAGIAHELNNPLMGIYNFVEYCLKHTEQEDKRYGILDDARQETQRCMDLVKNLLMLSRTSRHTDEEYRKERCETAFDRVAKLLSYRIQADKVRVIKLLPDQQLEIWTKDNSILQVFLNLMTNALDAVKESEKREIQFQALSTGEHVRITFADTGKGISSEHMQRIFDPFYTTKEVGKGTGLGLSVSKSIVEAHGGTMHCESEVGKGTVFEIVLPAKRIAN